MRGVKARNKGRDLSMPHGYKRAWFKKQRGKRLVIVDERLKILRTKGRTPRTNLIHNKEEGW